MKDIYVRWQYRIADFASYLYWYAKGIALLGKEVIVSRLPKRRG